MMRLVIIDYGMGNLSSVQQAFRSLGEETVISSEVDDLKRADGIVLPGVGAFPPAMRRMEQLGLCAGLRRAVERQIPTLGICLGMQLLYELGREDQTTLGLGLLRGEVAALPAGLKVPHMGWNQLRLVRSNPLLRAIPDGAYVYFVHSYYAAATQTDQRLAVTDYGVEVPAVVGSERLFGVQFHPEKSGELGLKILSNFLEVVRCSSSQPLI